MDEEVKQSLTDIQRKRSRLASQEEVNRFLLGSAMNVPYLDEQQLELEVGIVTRDNRKSPEQLAEAAALFRQAAKRKAEEDAIRYKLNDEDRVALELLYTGLTQAELLETGQPFEIKITKGEKTEYRVPSETLIPNEEQNPLIASIEAYLRSQRTPKPSSSRDRLVASPELYRALLDKFDHIGLIDDGTQLRRTADRMFKRSAAHALVLIDTLGQFVKKKNPVEGVDVFDPGYVKSPFTQEPLVLEFAPLTRIKDLVDGFQNFKKSL